MYNTIISTLFFNLCFLLIIISACEASSTKHQETIVEIATLENALKMLKLDIGRYPSQSEGMELLVKSMGNENWKGPYLSRKMMPLDSWRNPYQYNYPAKYGDKEFDLYSFGLNQKDDKGQNDDISNWKETELYTYYGSTKTKAIIEWGVSFTVCLFICIIICLLKITSIELIVQRFTKLTIVTSLVALLLTVIGGYSASMLLNIVIKSSFLGGLLFSFMALVTNTIMNIRTGFSDKLMVFYFLNSIPFLFFAYLMILMIRG